MKLPRFREGTGGLIVDSYTGQHIARVSVGALDTITSARVMKTFLEGLERDFIHDLTGAPPAKK